MKELINSTWEYLIRKINFDSYFDKQVENRWEELERVQPDKKDTTMTPSPHSGSEAQSEYERHTWINLGQGVQSFVQLAKELRLYPSSVKN